MVVRVFILIQKNERETSEASFLILTLTRFKSPRQDSNL